jgi:hypothetical protein
MPLGQLLPEDHYLIKEMAYTFTNLRTKELCYKAVSVAVLAEHPPAGSG